MPIDSQIIEAIESAKSLGCDLKIVSDANQFFIDKILEQHNMLDCFSEIYTNPTSVDVNGKLGIFRYHSDDASLPHTYNLCLPHLCKVVNECVEAAAWLREKQQQDTLPKYATPALLSADIKRKAWGIGQVLQAYNDQSQQLKQRHQKPRKVSKQMRARVSHSNQLPMSQWRQRNPPKAVPK